MKTVILFSFFVFNLFLFPCSSFSASALASASSTTPMPSTNSSFDSLIESALQDNENLKIEESKLRSLEFEKQAALGSFLPLIKAKAYRSATDQYTGSTQNSESIMLESSLNLFKFGGDSYTLSKINSQVQSAEYSVLNTRLNTEMTIANSLLIYISSQLKFQLSLKTLESKKEYYEIAKHRYAMGLLSSQDLDKVLIDLNNAESTHHDRELDIEKAKSDLKIELKNSNLNTENLNLKWPWVEKLNNFKFENVFTLENHPQWQMQNQMFNAIESEYKVHRANLLPRLDLTFSTGKSHLLDQPWASQWSGSIGLEIPLFSQFSDYANFKMANEQKTQASIKLEQLATKLRETFSVSERALKTAIQSASAREKTQKIAEKLYNDNLIRFKIGRTSVNDLLVDQERLTQTQYLNIQGWLDAHLNLIQYCQSLGLEQKLCIKK